MNLMCRWLGVAWMIGYGFNDIENHSLKTAVSWHAPHQARINLPVPTHFETSGVVGMMQLR